MSRAAFLGAVLVCGACALGCGRIRYDPLFENDFVVTVPDDRLAGPDTMTSPADLEPGTVGLSLREALVMAGNSDGGDLVRFDAGVFPASAPTTIVLGSALPVISDEGTVIDGRGAGVVIDGSSVADPTMVIEASRAGLRQLAIAGSGGVGVAARGAEGLELTDVRVEGAAGDGIQVDMAAGVNLTGVTVLDPSGRGLALTWSDGARIVGAHIERAGADLVSVMDAGDALIQDAFMVIGDKTALRGIHMERVTGSRVCDNVIDPGSARLINLLDSSDNRIERNILDRGHAGVVLEGVSLRNTVFQNVVIGSEYDGIYVGGEAADSVVVHNTLHQCSSAVVDGATSTTQGNNLVTDSDDAFVDPAAYDFHLVGGSPSIDAGEDLGYDCMPERAARFLGLAPDLGAVETR